MDVTHKTQNTHTHTHSHTHTYTRSRTCTFSLSFTLTNKYTHIHTLTMQFSHLPKSCHCTKRVVFTGMPFTFDCRSSLFKNSTKFECAR